MITNAPPDLTKKFLLVMNPFDYAKLSEEAVKQVNNMDVDIQTTPDPAAIPSGTSMLIPMFAIRQFLGFF